MNRRELLLAGAAVIAGAAASSRLIARAKAQPFPLRNPQGELKHRIPLVHITDLYHPPQDPDDHIDLATAAALTEYDLRGVILDATRKFLLPAPEGFDIRRDPGFIPVHQLGDILGRTIPVAAGPALPLAGPADDVSDRTAGERSGVRLLLNLLEESSDPVVVSVVGSARVLTAAYNRNPELVRSRVRSVLLNAGSTAGVKREWNVGLDPMAYIGLWKSGLPIHWFPCSTETGAFNPDHERGTYWKTTHAAIFRDLSGPLRAWFTFAFGPEHQGESGTDSAGKNASPVWDRILKSERNMWATASLVMGAGRVLARTPQGWRFMPASSVEGMKVWSWRLDNIDAQVNDNAGVRWREVKHGGDALLFGRERGQLFAGAMSEALCALLATLNPD